jgi:uncharacterized surface anchored protein
VTIHKKDPGGDTLQGASFELIDAVGGKTVAHGKTGADGALALGNLARGTYRLRETGPGSRLHDKVPDQNTPSPRARPRRPTRSP